jgi:hypothetical protein
LLNEDEEDETIGNLDDFFIGREEEELTQVINPSFICPFIHSPPTNHHSPINHQSSLNQSSINHQSINHHSTNHQSTIIHQSIINQSPLNQSPLNQSSIDQSINPPINQSTNHPIIQSFIQSINQSIHPSINHGAPITHTVVAGLQWHHNRPVCLQVHGRQQDIAWRFKPQSNW